MATRRAMHFRVGRNRHGHWWSLRAANGRVLGDGSGFNRRADMKRSLRKFARAGIPIVDEVDGLVGTT